MNEVSDAHHKVTPSCVCVCLPLPTRVTHTTALFGFPSATMDRRCIRRYTPMAPRHDPPTMRHVIQSVSATVVVVGVDAFSSLMV